MWIKHPKTGEPQVTLTVFITGTAVVTLKLLLSGVEIGGLTLAPFSGTEYAAAIGALGAIYWAKANIKAGGE